ncbi:MAG: ABC transporter permease [Bacilli bacterium]|nr:ABC transporter permease [Bacilli bacterium]MDD4076805.1 ABC transporter permease [Bacilli bacterium]MDD4388782.1 ABC transporter permease [Bacilli bacterium]
MKHSKKYRIARTKLILSQILLFILILTMWELGTRLRILDDFLFSKPSSIASLLWAYIKNHEIFKHIYISLLETVLGIVIGSAAGVFIAVILWASRRLTKLLEPFLVILNALPKTALAPIMIIWAGTGVTGIVVVAISILIVITILSTYNYFINVDSEKIQMMKSFNASKYQVFIKLVFPANLVNIISVVKINIGMAWVGVIVGEFLVSRSGIGNLIMYGGQIFRFDMVMMGVIVLSIFAYLMYEGVNIIEKILIKKRGKGI